ncbi:V-type ATP synthase subunit D [Candidatus Dependentiae bacterium]|nr:V-type ATP synthase subunit D [Candidatus Dependentiae bacterium]
MKIKIIATRMELLRLKRRLVLAKKGHKLLKEKLEELMRQFILCVNRFKGIRGNIKELLQIGHQNFVKARATVPKEYIESALSVTDAKTELKLDSAYILNIQIPKLKIEVKGDIHSYGFRDTSVSLDKALSSYYEVFEDMIKLAELEKTIYLIALEIEKTRRRVNALEYILIPNIADAIKVISMKLDERERANLTRLMKIKDIIQKRKQ